MPKPIIIDRLAHTVEINRIIYPTDLSMLLDDDTMNKFIKSTAKLGSVIIIRLGGNIVRKLFYSKNGLKIIYDGGLTHMPGPAMSNNASKTKKWLDENR